jgi:hypothetical protein
MDRDAGSIPIGQTVVVADTPYIRVTFTRVSDQEGAVQYTNPVNGLAVLKMRVGVYDGSSDIQYVDQNFWAVSVNGRPIAAGETAHGKVNVNAQARTINVTT